MPTGDGDPVTRVVLVCGHIRRHFDREQKAEYFCLDCDGMKEVEGKLQDPRNRFEAKVRAFPDRSKYRR